ncbi:hypothetical protein CKA32_002038 [Geitlerinema sp. FC II]|nr:hypothetical protein CKA32_002038 [Geitlerinema sp. FC II]
MFLTVEIEGRNAQRVFLRGFHHRDTEDTEGFKVHGLEFWLFRT